MSPSDPLDTPTEQDGQMDVAVQFVLGLFLMGAFVALVWLVVWL
jgi:hypothetical protein